MSKYFRLYTIIFETSSGLKIYGGKHHSKYDNPSDDPYLGSGNIIRSTIKKYGRSCVKKIQWSKCYGDGESLLEAEELLVDHLYLLYGKSCANIKKGGVGLSYLDPSKNPNIGRKRTAHSKLLMSKSAKNRVWTEAGLARRIQATRKMTLAKKHPDFSGGKNPMARAVKVDDRIFGTTKDCAQFYGVTKSAVIYRINSHTQKFSGWAYYDNV